MTGFPRPINPDCKAGKHGSCFRDAWDYENSMSNMRVTNITVREVEGVGSLTAADLLEALMDVPDDATVQVLGGGNPHALTWTVVARWRAR